MTGLLSMWRAVRGPFMPLVPRTSLARLHACDLLVPIAKRAAVPLDPKRASLRRLQAELTRVTASLLAEQVQPMAEQVRALLVEHGLVEKRASRDRRHRFDIDTVAGRLRFAEWAEMSRAVEPSLAEIYKEAAAAALQQVGIRPAGVMGVVDSRAIAYGQQRAAAMVGMRVDALGTLVPAPNAMWQITESTRSGLRALIGEAIDNGWSVDTLAKKMREAYAFSKSRAMLIARTETSIAANAGALEGYRASGVVTGKSWLTANDNAVTPDCMANQDAGAIALDANFPSGLRAPPDHQRCRCTLLPVVDWTMVDNIPSALTESP